MLLAFHLLLFILSGSLFSPVTANDAAVMSLLGRLMNPFRLHNKSYCTWKGITCDTRKHVTSIKLSSMSLTGTLPRNLNSLSHLTHIDFSNNSLLGPLPSLANLARLQIADFHHNNFDSIPDGCFHGLTSLQTLNLNTNQKFPRWTLPNDLSNSSNLQFLDLTATSLIGPLPEIFHSLRSLRSLILSNNSITGDLPTSLSGSAISDLILSYQEAGLSGTIEVLSSMTNLSKVSLPNNNFTGPIPDLSNSTNLNYLELRYNKLTGVIPYSLMNLSSLKYVFLDNNKLQGPVPGFGPGVEDTVYSNNFCNQNSHNESCDRQVTILLQIASAFGYPLQLSLSWKGNHHPCRNWSFVSCEVGHNIVELDFSKQSFSGTISPAFASLTYLRKLNLSHNHLCGPIPEALTTLPQLQFLDVSNNNLSGDLPNFSPNVKLYVSGNPLLRLHNSPEPAPQPASSPPPGNTHRIAGVVVGAGVVVICVMIFFNRKRCLSLAQRRIFKETSTTLNHNIEDFINISLAPKRYNFSDVKKMTNSFLHKLGQGGYGVVYKASLPDGCLVAIKVLNEAKGNGEEFINEVTSISKTSHVNIVSLLGFCYERNKRALIYEFMLNGSLDKFINEKGSPNAICNLDLNTLFRIAIGIARGLEYLHEGCNTKILHLDIKPQNILLNEDFCPKISDFGLAKICKKKESIVSLLGTRGTPGYIAPEVVCPTYGKVSHKSDVYSYGMLILEIVGGKKNCESGGSATSQMYFPDWIYKDLEEGNVIYANNLAITDQDNDLIRKITLVSLWCIQTNPLNRPSISKVIEMLEGPLQSVPYPPKPILYSPQRSPIQFSKTYSSSKHETDSITT
ncbi:hypothetical protein VNO77_21679 [Canavalia gladiata]|uniref:Protein kinase domain-containing protein n=1 Tax=Canavalia gladiata TaxID=3824 RepID=A0AAN9LRK0_CANGL